MTYSSFVNANPFTDGLPQGMLPPTPSPTMPLPLAVRRAHDPTKAHKAPGMSQSQSEPSLQSLDNLRKPQIAQYHVPQQYLPQAVPKGNEQIKAGLKPSHGRGRLISRPGSPIQNSQVYEEKQAHDEPKPSRNRSRSPVKRLLGMGKSSSLKDIAGEPQLGPKEKDEYTGKRTGMKLWGDRLKHGFLVGKFLAMTLPVLDPSTDIATKNINRSNARKFQHPPLSPWKVHVSCVARASLSSPRLLGD